ncbi:MAG: TIGR04372 family glycosyltransferase [Candidatus Omnitrophota bacterium]|nr:MAG: TIGR04372 family glycosyltransferase [Candidatus Omnitrophota bacterium]
MKSRDFLRKILAMLTIPAVLVIRILRPFVLIRFGKLLSDRIGHFAINTEEYLCEKDAGMYGRRIFDIFYTVKPICNQQLKKMWSRILHISKIAHFFDIANRCLPGYEDHSVSLLGLMDVHGLFVRTAPHLSFTPKEERMGLDGLRKMGIPEGVPFVCFHARNQAYLETVYPKADWHSHSHRNSDIYNYIPAVEKLVNRGYFAIRMGAVVKKKLNNNNPRIIDYAVNHRTDFLDIYLLAKCKFLINNEAGIHGVSVIFRRPVVEANIVHIDPPNLIKGENSLFILKKLWSRRKGRFLTFKEILNTGIGKFSTAQQYEKSQIELIENTPEEISAVSMEMDERLKNTWQTTEKDEQLQQQFWAILKPICPNENGIIFPRLGAEFLRQNKELLK